MKYTRYDIKKKKNDGVILILVLTIILFSSFIIGTIASNLFLKGKNIGQEHPLPGKNAIETQNKNVKDTGSESTKQVKSEKYLVVQGGMFQKKENIDATKNILAPFGNPFLIQDSKGTRVLLGIYNEENGLKAMKALTDKGIENSKMVFQIESNDLCTTEITGIINADLEILTKLTEKNVKSIQTDEIKKWLSTLAAADSKSKNYAILQDLIKYINNLPKDLTKDKCADNYIYIFNTLKKLQPQPSKN